MSTALVVTGLLLLLGPRQTGELAAQQSAAPLDGLQSLVGRWGAPAAAAARRPELADRVIHDYGWMVGRNALRLRESYRPGEPEAAQLEGIIYWNPASETIEFVAVAGHGPGQGRVFEGEYRLLADGSVERVYQVFYRTLEDIPAEEMGGMSRRYREVYQPVTPDSTRATLDWWIDGAWRPYGPGVYHLVRVQGLPRERS